MKGRELIKMVNYFEEMYPGIEFIFPLGGEDFATNINVFVTHTKAENEADHTSCIIVPTDDNEVRRIHGFLDKVKEGNYPNKPLRL